MKDLIYRLAPIWASTSKNKLYKELKEDDILMLFRATIYISNGQPEYIKYIEQYAGLL